VVEELAAKSRLPIELVKRVYDEELADVQRTAKVRTFVGAIARRRARDALRQHQPPSERAESRPENR
jgi:hypothetical protein